MLSKPQNGWTDFTLGDLSYSLSYLTNLPLEWLDRAIFGMETLLPFEVSAYCEPGKMICTVDTWECRIIYKNDESYQNDGVCQVVPINMLDFCSLLHKDISDHIEDWKNWNASFHLTKEDLTHRLDRLQKLIDIKSNCFP